MAKRQFVILQHLTTDIVPTQVYRLHSMEVVWQVVHIPRQRVGNGLCEVMRRGTGQFSPAGTGIATHLPSSKRKHMVHGPSCRENPFPCYLQLHKLLCSTLLCTVHTLDMPAPNSKRKAHQRINHKTNLEGGVQVPKVRQQGFKVQSIKLSLQQLHMMLEIGVFVSVNLDVELSCFCESCHIGKKQNASADLRSTSYIKASPWSHWLDDPLWL